MTQPRTASVLVDLSAAIVSVHHEQPVCLTVAPGDAEELASLPFGPFYPAQHRTMEIGLRQWVTEQAGLDIGYVEQLYTFGDRGRRIEADTGDTHVVSVGYLALSRENQQTENWHNWYLHFPWEDWRQGRPLVLQENILPRLYDWAGDDAKALSRINQAFGTPVSSSDTASGAASGISSHKTQTPTWDDERVLERYELMYEAGLIFESFADGRLPSAPETLAGMAMQLDHRRILATAISRLRAKLKYRPVVFEFMPPQFTLTQLQKTTEAVIGAALHKQNFRRLLAKNGLVEATGAQSRARGRPAELYRFRHDARDSHALPGFRISVRQKPSA